MYEYQRFLEHTHTHTLDGQLEELEENLAGYSGPRNHKIHPSL